MVKMKKSGFITKVIVIALLGYMAVTFLELQGQIRQSQAERDSLSRQVAEQAQKVADLEEILENPDDPERGADIARDRLNLVMPGEKVFVITN